MLYYALQGPWFGNKVSCILYTDFTCRSVNLTTTRSRTQSTIHKKIRYTKRRGKHIFLMCKKNIQCWSIILINITTYVFYQQYRYKLWISDKNLSRNASIKVLICTPHSLRAKLVATPIFTYCQHSAILFSKEAKIRHSSNLILQVKPEVTD